MHLLRELEKVDQHNDSPEWQAFAKKLRRLVRDGIRLRKRPDFEPQRYESRIRLIDRRLTALAQWRGPDGEPIYRDADALRLAKRLRKHLDHLFTCPGKTRGAIRKQLRRANDPPSRHPA